MKIRLRHAVRFNFKSGFDGRFTMKFKRLVVFFVVLSLVSGIFAGCKKGSGDVDSGDKTFNGNNTEKNNENQDNTERKTVEIDMTSLSAFSLSDVTITDEYYENALLKDVDYLLAFDTDKLLAGFRETAGLDMKGKTRYSGWETSLIGGHTIGHYMTACVRAYETLDSDPETRAKLLDILVSLTDGLKECQDNVGTGFVFGATILDKSNIEKQFDNVEKNQTNITTQAWVPWYTMHKIMEGLVSTAGMDADSLNITDSAEKEKVKELSATAITVVSNLADWVYNRASKWSSATRSTVLGIEYGGMNDVLYDTYLLTNKSTHLEAAHIFDQTTLFEKVAKADVGDNVLNNLHANTTIPKFLGALKRYVVTGEKEYLNYAEKFWTLVVNDHSYITGGNSEWEHFGKDDVLDAERTNCNCETCNSYNMLKMTKLLFMITGDVKYADWYENTLINSIMSSQNPETGMTTYFQPMASGYFKVYGERFNKFWCCTGSGMENFTKLSESFYFHKETENGKILVVNQYIASDLEASGYMISAKGDLTLSDTMTYTVNKDYDGTILFRLPEWLNEEPVITLNGKTVDYAVATGYAVITDSLKKGDVITITLPMGVTAYNLPDGTNTYAFKYGPFVLSALLGTDDMVKTTTGVNVTIPSAKVFSTKYISSGSEKITVYADSVSDYMENINTYMVKTNTEDGPRFTLTNADSELTYVIHYRQYTERYGIYFRFTDDASALSSLAVLSDKKNKRNDTYLLDTVQPGYGQYENDELHMMTESGAGSEGTTEGNTTRKALKDGSFSYTMIADKAGTDIVLTLDSEDNGKNLTIKAGEDVIYTGSADSNGVSGYYDTVIEIPEDVLSRNCFTKNVSGTDKTVITITISGGAENEADSARICGFLYTMKKLSRETGIKEITAENGNIYYNADLKRYIMIADKGVMTAEIKTTLFAKCGYLTINSAATDEENISIVLNDGGFTYADMTVYAEDFITNSSYELLIVSADKTGDTVNQNGVTYKVNDTDNTLTVKSEIGSDTLVYFVDCGDHDPSTVSKGDSFGIYNGVTEQIYTGDPVTGFVWGIVDDPTDLYGGSSLSNGVYTANTWCYEYNSKSDGLDKTSTNRYTKNQYENGIDRKLEYAFELPDGKYYVRVMFVNPWSCSTNPWITAYKGTENEQVLIKNAMISDDYIERRVNVVGGKLDLTFTTSDKCINLCYIEIVAAGDISSETVYTKVK